MEMLHFLTFKHARMAKLARKDVGKKKGMSEKLADIDVSARHVADMLPTFPTKMHPLPLFV
jgi:hypothetical protein